MTPDMTKPEPEPPIPPGQEEWEQIFTLFAVGVFPDVHGGMTVIGKSWVKRVRQLRAEHHEVVYRILSDEIYLSLRGVPFSQYFQQMCQIATQHLHNAEAWRKHAEALRKAVQHEM